MQSFWQFIRTAFLSCKVEVASRDGVLGFGNVCGFEEGFGQVWHGCTNLFWERVSRGSKMACGRVPKSVQVPIPII